MPNLKHSVIKHAATPYRFKATARVVFIEDAAGVKLCDFAPDAVGRVDAQFMVKACNAYDELVQVLTDLERHASELCDRDVSQSLAVFRARDTLAVAYGVTS